MALRARRQRIRRWPWGTILHAVAGIWILAAVVIALGPTRSWAAVAANATLFVGLIWLSTVAHEAGHALAARALGMRVSRVLVGQGPSLLTKRLFGAEWRFGSVPFGGMTFSAPRDGGSFRLRLWLMFAAGPLVTAFLFGIGMLLARADAALELAPARMLQASNAVLLISCAVPIPARGRPTPVPDALMLLFMWRMPRLALNELRAAAHYDACVTALRHHRTVEAAAACAAGLAEDPESIALLNADALVDLDAGRFESAREKFVSLLERPDVTPQLQALLRNNVAWTAVMLGDADMLRDADEISKDVLERMPTASAHGTRGAVLVLRGKPWKASRHLRRAYERHDDDSGSAHAAAWLAAAEAAFGRFTEADEWLATAETLDPECQSLPLARRLVNRRRKRHERRRERMGDVSVAVRA